MSRSRTSVPASGESRSTASGDMQLATFELHGLFGELDHSIEFPTPLEGNPGPSLVILHGPNGVGKTTILRMIDGMMRLDFNPFRRVPVKHCKLSFTTGEYIEVEPKSNDALEYLVVRYDDHEVRLHPRKPGALVPDQRPVVEAFRQSFFRATESLDFELIETTRIVGTLNWMDDDEYDYLVSLPPEERDLILSSRRRRVSNPKARKYERTGDLAARVQRFVREAQVNYRHYFSSTEPDLFPRILQRLTDSQPNQVRAEDLLKRLRRIREQDQHARKLGLATEQWDYEQLARFLEEQRASADITHALTVLSAYVETLESGAAERELLANRLQTFESLMSEFLEDKEVMIHPRQGFAIVTSRGEELHESQLSSGEYHLLYLMVSALVTQRRGTVIAIDEPEMSMHIKWQRRLISALVKVASNAEPQFIFATHSPDIAAEFPDDMVMLAVRE